MFKEECSDCVLGQNSSKSLYNLLLNSDDHVIKIHVVERNVDLYYSFVFKIVFDKFVDIFSEMLCIELFMKLYLFIF